MSQQDQQSLSPWVALTLAIGLPLSLAALTLSFIAFTRSQDHLAYVKQLTTQPLSPNLGELEGLADQLAQQAASQAVASVQSQIAQQTQSVQALVELQLAERPAPQPVAAPQPDPQPQTEQSEPGAADLALAEARSFTLRRCGSCHNVDPGAPNKVGPNLWGVGGQPAGLAQGFTYSRVLRQRAESGLVWNEDNLRAFIESPRSFMPGTRMGFQGLNDPDQVDQIIGYLLAIRGDG